jgi:TRAP-type C4-dicarboxylate transport system permease small subunit
MNESKEGKQRKAGYFPAMIGAAMVLFAGFASSGAEATGRLLGLIYLVLFIGGCFLLGFALILGILRLLDRFGKGRKT